MWELDEILALSAVIGGVSFFFGSAAHWLWIHRKHPWASLKAWFKEQLDSPPWADPLSIWVYGNAPGYQSAYFVSRHAIAETGLQCPVCNAEVAPKGNYEAVRRMLVNGEVNEVVICRNPIVLEDGQKRICNAILIASPDTEHGDHLRSDDPDEFYRFVRVAQLQAIQTEYGNDILTFEDRTNTFTIRSITFQKGETHGNLSMEPQPKDTERI